MTDTQTKKFIGLLKVQTQSGSLLADNFKTAYIKMFAIATDAKQFRKIISDRLEIDGIFHPLDFLKIERVQETCGDNSFGQPLTNLCHLLNKKNPVIYGPRYGHDS